MPSRVIISPASSYTSALDTGNDTQALYFNETGPIYRTEHVQAKEFVNLVRAHIVVENPDKGTDSGRETAWFDWGAFRTAVASLQGKVPPGLDSSGISMEHEIDTTIPPAPATTAGSTTIQTVLDALVAQFASTPTNVLFVPPTPDNANSDGCGNSRSNFFDTFRKNLYHAFTHHLDERDTPERCLSFHKCAHARSAWEYRLLFVHSDARSQIVKGLVMTVRLEGRFEGEQGDAEKRWYGISLDSSGPFSGALKAMQVIVEEGFRYS